MGCGLQAQGVESETADESLGLVYSHAYSILRVARVKDKMGSQVNLVQLRNPWGELDWTGAWSDNSSDWSPALEKELNLQRNTNDGVFWMSFNDFEKHCGTIYLCYVHDHFNFVSK